MATYQIVTIPNYYEPDIQGKNAVKISDEIYDSIADAKERIEELEDGTYCLANGEAGRPDYYVVESVDADYIASGRNEDMGNYDWTDADCDCGECNACCGMMIDQDRDYVQSNAVAGPDYDIEEV